MSMTVEDMQHAVVTFVNIAEEVVSKGFEELDNNGVEIIIALDELEKYRAIGTVSEFRELKEKATAKRKCLNCNELLNPEYRFCPTCRRKVDWSEGKE